MGGFLCGECFHHYCIWHVLLTSKRNALSLNKRQKKPKVAINIGQSRNIDSIGDTRNRKKTHTKTTTQKTKTAQKNGPLQKPGAGVNSGAHERQAAPASPRTPVMLFTY